MPYICCGAAGDKSGSEFLIEADRAVGFGLPPSDSAVNRFGQLLQS